MSKNRVFPDLTEQEEQAVKEEARQRCVTDLHYLAKQVLGYNRLTDHCHRRMAQDIDTPNFKFRLLLWPRGHFKSTIGTESRSVQKLLRNPNERILISNAKLNNSQKFLRAIASHWQNNAMFKWLWRDWWLENYASPFHKAEYGDKLDWITRDTQDEFSVLRPYAGREASITTGAVDASLVSQHYSTIIADDLINREYVRTIDMVEKSVLYFKDLLDLLDPDGELEIIGTRWSHMDLYGWIIEEFGGTASLRIPKDYVGDDIVEKSEKTPESEKDWMISIQPCYTSTGEPIFPEEFTSQVLGDLQRVKGPYEFGAQYELDPTPKESQKFQEEWFNKLDILPDVSSMQICITVDPAKSIEDEADRTAITVCGYDDSNYMYFLDGLNERITVDELPEALFELVTEWDNRGQHLLPVGFEAVGFQEIYLYNLERMMMERNYFFAIEPIKRRKQSKEERILRLVPRIKNGFYMPKKLLKDSFGGREAPYDLSQRLLWQLLKFPFAGEDDLADALADQLDIVKAHGLPVSKPPKITEQKKDFVHRSLLEDKGKISKLRQYSDAVR